MEIEQFLSFKPQNTSENKPLVILSDECFGRKTFLIKWIEYHQINNRTNYPIQDIILPFFSTVSEKNSNCFYAIYRFLVQLREKLNVKQKVELLEDKLRKYFGYWLEVCVRKIKYLLNFFFMKMSKIYYKVRKLSNKKYPKTHKLSSLLIESINLSILLF